LQQINIAAVNHSRSGTFTVPSRGARMDAKQDQYLRRAKEAEDLAASTSDPGIKKSWLEIAEGYRALARTELISQDVKRPAK